MSGGGYAAYLRLPQLLSAQSPRSEASDPRVHSAEHFFIVVHQATELWLKQILIDLDQASAALMAPGRDAETALDHLHRVIAIQQLLTAHLGMFSRLQPVDFTPFRRLLGSASGAQSEQFLRLQRVLGLADGRSPVFTAFTSTIVEHNLMLTDVYRSPAAAGVFYRIAEALIDISEHYWMWVQVHLSTAERMLGHGTSGTGGTSGVGYLAARAGAKPFQLLWDARTALHQLTSEVASPYA